MTIREYKAGDEIGIKACFLEIQGLEHGYQPQFWRDPSEVSADEVVSALLKTSEKPGGKLYVAEEDNSVVGYLGLSNSDIEDEPGFIAKKICHVNELVVLRSYQGRGIAKALMAEAEKYAKSTDCMYVSLSVTSGNSAVDFYRKHGYEVSSQNMRKII
jgi:ribosomal protein S18 acetylase RimI-like enzyme